MPVNRRRKTLSISISPQARQLLEQLAEANNQSLSSTVETLILHAKNTREMGGVSILDWIRSGKSLAKFLEEGEVEVQHGNPA